MPRPRDVVNKSCYNDRKWQYLFGCRNLAPRQFDAFARRFSTSLYRQYFDSSEDEKNMASMQFRQVLSMMRQDDNDVTEASDGEVCPKCPPTPELDYNLFRRGSLEVPEGCLCKHKSSRRQSVHWADESFLSIVTPRSDPMTSPRKPKSILKRKEASKKS